jgi:hypothetical protein
MQELQTKGANQSTVRDKKTAHRTQRGELFQTEQFSCLLNFEIYLSSTEYSVLSGAATVGRGYQQAQTRAFVHS